MIISRFEKLSMLSLAEWKPIIFSVKSTPKLLIMSWKNLFLISAILLLNSGKIKLPIETAEESVKYV